MKEGKIHSLERIYLHSLPIKKHQIFDTLVTPCSLKDEVMNEAACRSLQIQERRRPLLPPRRRLLRPLRGGEVVDCSPKLSFSLHLTFRSPFSDGKKGESDGPGQGQIRTAGLLWGLQSYLYWQELQSWTYWTY
ncbi:hypothetical protein ACFX2J_000493 [Malus domestica]